MTRLSVVACVVAVLGMAGASAVSADTASRPCTVGDARANFQAPYEHLLASLGVCQYRLFFDGATFEFCEGDHVLGGVVNSIDYRAAGLTREEAIDLLKTLGPRVWLDGVEEPLASTVFKDGVHPLSGDHVVYQHHAFVKRLTVGHHVSYLEVTLDGVVDFTATVQLVVLPWTDSACR